MNKKRFVFPRFILLSQIYKIYIYKILGFILIIKIIATKIKTAVFFFFCYFSIIWETRVEDVLCISTRHDSLPSQR